MSVAVAQKLAAKDPVVSESLINFVETVKRDFGDRLRAVVLFGSQARKTARATSDIDILLVAEELPAEQRAIRKVCHGLEAKGRQAGLLLEVVAATPHRIEASVDSLHPLTLEIWANHRVLWEHEGFFQRLCNRMDRRTRELHVVPLRDHGWRCAVLPDKQQIAQSLLSEAWNDLVAARALQQAVPARAVAHCQACVEKTLRAAMTLQDVIVTDRHRVADDFLSLFRNYPEAQRLWEIAKSLEEEGVGTEYPLWDEDSEEIWTPSEHYREEDAARRLNDTAFAFETLTQVMIKEYGVRHPQPTMERSTESSEESLTTPG